MLGGEFVRLSTQRGLTYAGSAFTEKQASVSRWPLGVTPGGPTVLMTGPSRTLDLGGHVSNVAWRAVASSHPHPELFKDGPGAGSRTAEADRP